MKKYIIALMLCLICCCFASVFASCNGGGAASVSVNVSVSVSGITCPQSSITLEEGEEYVLSYTLKPSDSTDKTVSFTSSDIDVATVSSDGVVYAVSSGTAMVTITTLDGGFTAECQITVNEKTYSFAFIADGETVSYGRFTKSGGISVPEVPEKVGYTGTWESYSLDGGDITVNAVYIPIEYTALFVDDNETVICSVPYTVESVSIDEPEVPKRDYYTGAWEDYLLTAGDITIKCVYTPEEYGAAFVADGETVATLTYTIENWSVVAPEIPGKIGYDGEWENYELAVGGITVNAVYTPVIYCATFMASGALVGYTYFTVESQSIEMPEVPIQDGYTGEWESAEIIPGDITVYAVYTLVTYNITYLNTKDAENPNAVSFTAESVFAFEKISAQGYIFEGWYLNGEKINSVSGIYSDVTVTAQWSLVQYAVVFTDEHYNEICTVYYTIENPCIDEPLVPEKDGYIGSWSSYLLNYETAYVYAVYTPIESDQ